jgi:hypothetical protein
MNFTPHQAHVLDFGISRTLMYSIRRVRLQLALATTTCESPPLPLDALTRCRVTDAIQATAEKELAGHND